MEMMHGVPVKVKDPTQMEQYSLRKIIPFLQGSTVTPMEVKLAMATVLLQRSLSLRRPSSLSLMITTVAGVPVKVKKIVERKASKAILILKPVRLSPRKRKPTITETLLVRNLSKTLRVPT